MVDPLDFIWVESFFGVVELSYKFGTRPVSVALPLVELLLVDSDGAAGCFKTDSAPGAAGIDGLSELPDPDELPLLEGAELFGANVLGGLALGEEDVELEPLDGANGVEVIVCVVIVDIAGAGIIIVCTGAATASVAPVQGSIGTFITMVRGVR